MHHTPLRPGVRPDSNEYGERWQPPEPPSATTWATPPPGEGPKDSDGKLLLGGDPVEPVALTAAEQAIRLTLEERRREGEARTNERTRELRARQEQRAAELAARYALPASELRALLEEHHEALAPYYTAVAEGHARAAQVQADRDRAAAFARAKATEVHRLEAAEQTAIDEYSAACEAALSSGDVPMPYTGAIDVNALHGARVESRAAADALRRVEEATDAVLSSALDGPRRELKSAVDRLIYDKLIAPRIARLRAAYEELQRLRPEIWGYRVAGVRDIRFAENTSDLDDEVLGIKPVLPGELPAPVERAAHELREIRAVLIAGDLGEREAPAAAAA
jgi:hypothetical protein